MKTTLLPYLYFNGQTADAMKFYQAVLGGELKMQKYSETGSPTSDENKDKIIHADLRNDLLSMMGSDGNSEYPITMGNNVHLSIVGDDEQQLTKIFNGLADGGKVGMPLAKQFWGDIYGQLTDKFGICWDINITAVKPQA